jgi:uncharacterized protein YegL
VDLVLLVDGSKSVRPQNFELVKRFVNQIVDFLDVSPEGTRVGLVQFSSRVRTEFPLGRYGTAAEVKQAVLAVEYMERGTMTGLALRHMVEHSFSEAQGARPRDLNVPRVGLVFTDGRSQDDISVWAARAKEEGRFGKGWTGVGLELGLGSSFLQAWSFLLSVWALQASSCMPWAWVRLWRKSCVRSHRNHRSCTCPILRTLAP